MNDLPLHELYAIDILPKPLGKRKKKMVIKIFSHGNDMCVNKFVIVVKRKNLFPKS